jgi:RimJ/RimL family protein N-acetyltransferase
LNRGVLTPDYPIRTERLALRPYDAGDFDDALRYWSIGEVTRYVPMGPYTRETFPARFERVVGRSSIAAEGEGLVLAIVPDEVGHAVGDMTLHWASDQHRTGEIGFILHPDHQGRGYATEASLALLALAFDRLQAHRMMARLDARNGASAAVLRKLGLRHEAHLVENEWIKGEWTDELVYAVLEREWRAQHGPADIGYL